MGLVRQVKSNRYFVLTPLKNNFYFCGKVFKLTIQKNSSKLQYMYYVYSIMFNPNKSNLYEYKNVIIIQ